MQRMRRAATVLGLLLVNVCMSLAQIGPTDPTTAQPPSKAAETLYLQLRRVGLDKSRVFRVRDVSFNRAAVHITLDDGVIAFTEDVAGHVTGAFFEGDGEVLLVPPDQAERASMALFTGAAILEERFITAYFRFNDNTFTELLPSLRRADDLGDFVSQWNETSKNLAVADALRLLLTFSRSLPIAGQNAPGPDPSIDTAADDRMLHVRLQGQKLGVFDVVYDSKASEQIWVGQLRTAEGTSYYDLWTSFAATRPGTGHEALNAITEEGKSGDITISRFNIRADVHPPTDLSAETSLQATVHQGGQRAVLFELSRFLQIKEVDADGHPLEFIHNSALEGSQRARLGNDLVALIFPEPLKAGQKLNLHFVYGGEVLSEAGNGLLYVGARGTWYPNRGLAMADFDLEFHTPPGWTLLATGKRVDVSAPSANPAEQVTHWVSERPIPVAGFNLGRYTRAVAHAGNVLVEAYAAEGVERAFPKAPNQGIVSVDPFAPGARAPAPPVAITPPAPSPARNVQPVADRSARAVTFFEKRFGPYPYNALALTQIPGALSQGWPGLIYLTSFSFLSPADRQQLRMPPVETILSQSVVAHETAHQWWGDLIGWSGYRDQWIVEGLANYSSFMLLESENPEQFRAVMDHYRDDLLGKNKAGDQLLEAGPVTLGSRLSSSHFLDGYEAISYGRGTWLFHMLRNMMRDASRKNPRSAQTSDPADEPFVRALRKVRERYAGKSITTRDLLQVFEEELPPSLWYEDHKSLDWFYQGWVNGTAVPHFELQGVKYNDKTGSTLVNGTIIEKSAAKDLVTPVPVYAVIAGKTTFLGQVFVDGPETPFHLTAPSGTRKLVLDPAGTLLTRH